MAGTTIDSELRRPVGAGGTKVGFVVRTTVPVYQERLVKMGWQPDADAGTFGAHQCPGERLDHRPQQIRARLLQVLARDAGKVRPQMTSKAAAALMAGARIAQHSGRPSTPNGQARAESPWPAPAPDGQAAWCRHRAGRSRRAAPNVMGVGAFACARVARRRSEEGGRP